MHYTAREYVLLTTYIETCITLQGIRALHYVQTCFHTSELCIQRAETCIPLLGNVHPSLLNAGARQARCGRAEYGLPAAQIVVIGEIHLENVHSLRRNVHSLR